ncbi:MAG TPA: glycoside hydrolase family 9 protein [Acidothermaceae bacterium]|nr:glycoside hydrolase family 9 protein [Acidothermaceae bacterium]
MARFSRARSALLTVALTVGSVSGATLLATSSAQAVGLHAQVRVDQVGYLPTDAKHAYLMASGKVAHATWDVVDAKGRSVAHGAVGTKNRGAWNANYPAVYDISFTKLTKQGEYRLRVRGDVSAVSPTFAVESAEALYGHLVTDGVKFYQVQRDGADVVPGALNRQPSHLNDAHATVYQHPNFVDPANTDEIAPGDLTRIAGAPAVDVSGGWFDAGDYLKFTHSAAYGDVLLYASARALGPTAPKSLANEAAYGEQWLDKMWDMSTKTLYSQVGIGSGNGSDTQDPTFVGDHDIWRLPQADDSDINPLDRYAAAHRPVFEAAPPGQPISPNLAGRTAAAFALAAQVDSFTDKAKAQYEYTEAVSLYAMAATKNPPDPLVTADPFGFYPESVWHDDMELGGAEIALAALALHHDPKPYLADAATWAKAYIVNDTGDTFNLYDVSALAHTDLAFAIQLTGAKHLAVTRGDLVNDLKRQILDGEKHAATDPFRAAGDVNNFDVDSHTFGWIAMAAWYKALTGDSRFDAFAAEERNWLFGANAWGASFMVGEGATFPHCMQHQVANLAGSLNGKGPIAVGAVVNGPNDNSNFEGGLGDLMDGMRKCPVNGKDPFAAFNGHGASFVDDVRSWQTDEPALDMTGAAIIASASQLAVHRWLG